LLHLVGINTFEYMMMHRFTNPKFLTVVRIPPLSILLSGIIIKFSLVFFLPLFE